MIKQKVYEKVQENEQDNLVSNKSKSWIFNPSVFDENNDSAINRYSVNFDALDSSFTIEDLFKNIMNSVLTEEETLYIEDKFISSFLLYNRNCFSSSFIEEIVNNSNAEKTTIFIKRDRLNNTDVFSIEIHQEYYVSQLIVFPIQKIIVADLSSFQIDEYLRVHVQNMIYEPDLKMLKNNDTILIDNIYKYKILYLSNCEYLLNQYSSEQIKLIELVNQYFINREDFIEI